jgi:SAM-dependent methyltransferase
VKILKLSYVLASALLFNRYIASAPEQTDPVPGSKAPTSQGTTAGKQLRSPDVVYVPTPAETVDAMLKVAKVGKEDVVFDLGSGDGRIPIMAVQKYNAARATGIDINPDRIKEAQANLKAAGVGDRVRFLNEDLFQADISEATVVTLYLLPSLNLKLLPKLLSDLKPGTRIVSHAFDMGSWKPQQTLNVGGSTIYFWIIPATGTPEYEAASTAASKT